MLQALSPIMWLVIIGMLLVLVALLGLLLTSREHKQQRRAFFQQTIPLDQTTHKRLAGIVGADGALASSAALFDVLYHTWQLDPHVLRGIDHLHHRHEFDNLSDLMTYMRDQILADATSTSAFEQVVDKYKGYAGEQVVADELSADGADVDMPESGTQPGSDMHVDGEPNNVKTTTDEGYVQEHLNAHPDVDAIVPSELAGAFADENRVTSVAGFSHDQVESATGDTLETIDQGLGGSVNGLPLITLVASTYRGYQGMRGGWLDGRTAVEHVAVDTAAKGGGMWVGSKLGLAGGLIMAPATGGLSAIVFPAAGTVAGTLLGATTGGSLSRWFKGRHLRKAIEQLQAEGDAFRDAFMQRWSHVVGVPRRFYGRLIESAQRQIATRDNRLTRILFPSTPTVFFQLAKRRAKAEQGRWVRYYQDLARRVQRAKQGQGGILLYAQGSAILQNDGELLKHYEATGRLLEVVEQERRKVG